MATTHVVQQGEHITRIARQYGFFDYRLIWDDAANRDLKKSRPNPHVLMPGDRLQIPDKQLKWEQRPTTERHTFQIVQPPLKLRLAIRDFDNVPVMNAPCELEIEGATYSLTTDGDGLIEKDILPTAERGRLRVEAIDLDVRIQIGHLDPHDGESGWLARLTNLGYTDDRLGTTDSRELQSDIEEFQCDFGLDVTGVFDERTKAKLKQIHGD